MSQTFKPKQYEIEWPYTGPRFTARKKSEFWSKWFVTPQPGSARSTGVRRRLLILKNGLRPIRGVDHAVSVSSGGTALEIATRLLGIGPGDEVLVTALTFKATVLPDRHGGSETGSR